MEIGSDGSLPPQQTETTAPAVGIPVTEVVQEKKSLLSRLNPLNLLKKADKEPMAVGSGMAEQLPPAAQQLDSGTPNATDFATASTATVADAGPAIDANSVLSDMNNQIDTVSQMSAQGGNPMPGIPPMPLEQSSAPVIPDIPPTSTSPEPSPLTPLTEKAA